MMRNGASGVNPDVQPTLAIFNMKNRFRDEWNDKTTTELTGKITTEEIGAGSRKLMAFLGNIAERSGEAGESTEE